MSWNLLEFGWNLWKANHDCNKNSKSDQREGVYFCHKLGPGLVLATQI